MTNPCSFLSALSYVVDSSSKSVAVFMLLSSPLAAVTSCDSRPLVQAGVRHPRDEYVVRSTNQGATISISGQADREAEDLQRRCGAIIGYADTVGVGMLEGDPSYTIGSARDVAVDDAGRLYVLDSRFHEVKVFDTNGALLESVGGRGKGPGEFAGPTSIAVDGKQRLYVGDMTRVVHVFDWSDGRLKYKRMFRLRVEPRDMCFMRGHLLVHGLTLEDNRLIHVYDRDGSYERSFAVLYDSGNGLVDYKLSLGRIACLQSEGTVVYAPISVIPEIRGYSIRGDLLWVTRVLDYKPILFEEMPGGSRITVPGRGYHRILSLVSGGGGCLVLQIAFLSREGWQARREFTELYSFELAPASGTASSVHGINSPIRAISRSYYVSSTEDPYPRLVISFIGDEGGEQ